MVAEPWINKMRNQVSASFKHALSLDNMTSVTKKKKNSKPLIDSSQNLTLETIGILSFEVASALSKTIHLHRSLSETGISNLCNDILKSQAIRTLVSADESYLLELVLAEKLDELNRIAALVSRLGKKCTEQVLVGFEHVYSDLLKGRIEVGKLAFTVKDMEKKIKNMERYASSTASLYGELGVLNELEQGTKKSHLAQHHKETHRALEQKIQWQRHDVRHLRDTSLWNQTYDKIVGLMARTVCTIYARIRIIFGESALAPESSPDEIRQLSSKIVRHHHDHIPGSRSLHSHVCDTTGQTLPTRSVANLREDSLSFACGTSPGRFFMECVNLSSSASWEDSDEHYESEGRIDRFGIRATLSREQTQCEISRHGVTCYGLKNSVTMHAAPSTVGGSALALHYANVIIIIENFLRYPHLVGEDARDDLYQMLPMSLRMSLRRSLRSYVKNLAIYDAPLAHEWKETLGNLLAWLAPMAHNMIRWQTERNFEQQKIVSRTNVLLLETLYFADREKTEATICELLVGLNYICRYEHQNALLDCSSSADFDECVNWQLDY